MSHEFKRIAVADDLEVDDLCVIVVDMDAEPVPIYDRLGDLEQAVSTIRNMEIDALIIDFDLSTGAYAKANGAEICASFYRSDIAYVLVSSFLEQESAVSIREHRRKIPRMLDKSEQDPDLLHQALTVCWQENNGVFLPDRKPRRVPLKIMRVSEGEKIDYIDAEIPSWKRNTAVRFPLSLIAEEYRTHLENGAWWLADVNIGSSLNSDLYLDRLIPAPEPPDDEFFK